MSRERDYLFELWAPRASPWSVWAKPVLFAHVVPVGALANPFAPPPPTAPAWAPRADGSTLLVADLPGARSVQLAERLVFAGFRPVPLFNAIPGPQGEDASLVSSIVDVQSEQ